jgi:cytochrome c5
MTINRLITLSFMTSLFVAGCKTTKHTEVTTTPVKPPVDCGTTTAVYETDIKPIFSKSCNRCHGDLRKAAGYDFRKIEDLKRAADKGELLGTIKWAEGYAHMPMRGDKLDDATIHTIECWVQNGMKQ